jgi:4-amino-4-deoxy-L-arabinose transferase-like glycosyltransferase
LFAFDWFWRCQSLVGLDDTVSLGARLMFSWIDRLVQRPREALLVLCLAQLVIWSLAPILTHHAPPHDVLEGYMWGREWLLGTHKHPPLPGWLLETTRLLTGSVTWPAYVLPQVCIILAYGFIFRLGCDLMDGSRALAGTLLLTGIYFFSWPTPELNHNLVQLPIWSAMLLCLWRAPQAQSSKIAAFWWIMGALCAAGLTYSKYSAALLIVTAAIWLFADPESRRALLTTPWPWLALAVFLVVAGPGLLWLSQNYEGPLDYAAGRSNSGSAVGVPGFVALQLACHSAMLVMMLIVGWIGPRRNPEDLPLVSAPLSQRGWMFLIWFGVAPLLMILVGAKTFSVGLRGAWGAPLWLMSGLLAVALISDRFDHRSLVRLATTTALVLPLVAIVYAGTMVFGPSINRRPSPVNWPQAEIAKRMLARWHEVTDLPLRIVIGESEPAGLVALTAPDNPSLVIDGDLSISPWVSRERIEEQGALVVWRKQPEHPLSKELPVYNFALGLPVAVESFKWPRRTKKTEPLQIGYAIILPKGHKPKAPVAASPANSGARAVTLPSGSLDR